MEATLASSEFQRAAQLLADAGSAGGSIAGIATAAAAGLPDSDAARLEALAAAAGDPHLVARYVLLVTMLRNLDHVHEYPVVDEVKARLLDFFLYVCAPDGETELLLNPRQSGFRAMCRMATLQRFPTGQFDWEISGVPKSWLWKAPRRDALGLALTVWGKAGGVWPYFAVHTSYRRELPILTREDEVNGMRLLAGSIAMQPEIRGVIGASWMLDPELKRVSPHMKWIADMHEEQRRYGAFFTTAGPAPESAGYLEGDRKRRRAYEAGEWKPRIGISIWPRQGLIAWLRDSANA